MAIYRFEAKLISRGGGRSAMASASYRTGKFANGGKSAVSAAAYRAGAQLTDERTGQRYDYTNKQGVLGAEIMLPDGAVPWMQNRQQLWAAVEQIEKRRDAQLARDFILTLPVELSQAQREDLTREFVREQFCSKGLVADVAWHAPSRQGDERNFHAHVMVPMRRIEGDGFARKKDRPAGPEHPAQAWAAELTRLRVAWADAANRHLEAAGFDVRIDHRSLAEQGVDREPEPKLGPLATQIERDGRESLAGNDNRDVRARNAELAALRVELAATAAEEAQLIDLMTQRMRRGAMDDHAVDQAAALMPALIRDAADNIRAAEEAARATMLREAELTARRAEAFKTQAQIDEEKARREHADTVAAEAIRRRDGNIASAEARYTIVLGDTAHPDPLTNLVRAAGAESAAFMRGQEAKRAQLADPKLSDDQKQEINLHKQIEFHEYYALTNERLAGMYKVVGGAEHTAQATYRTELATAARDQALSLREERGQLLETQQRQHRDEMADKLGGLARSVAAGAEVNRAAPIAQTPRPSADRANEEPHTEKAAPGAALGKPAAKDREPAETTDAKQVRSAYEESEALQAKWEAAPKPTGKGRGGGKGR